MLTKEMRILAVFFAAFVLFPGAARAINCSGLPTQFTGNEFPTGDFFSNFNNPCYTIPFSAGHGSGGEEGDLNATYFKAFFKVNPKYQLIILGAFPNARYFSVAVYDAHSAYSQSILDTSITPLTSQYINPYLPGATFISGQLFAVPINFGGTPGTLETGCMMNGYNVGVNGLDGTQRHAGMDWNSDTGVFQTYPGFEYHVVDTPQHTNPNTAGGLLVRAYLDISNVNYNTSPHIIVRDVASGCAYPAAYALSTLQIVTNNSSTGNSWLDNAQVQGHTLYENSYLPKLCFANNSQDSVQWLRRPEYVPGASPDSSYTVATVPAGTPANLAAAGEVMRIRFQMPSTPPTPCTKGCSRSGNEQLRYLSLSFIGPAGVTYASVADNAFTQDSKGNVTLIVGTGATIPSWITPANGYTFLDLTPISGFQNLNLLDLRNILPAATFNCGGQELPYRTGEYTPAGGLMGAYLPVVDYPVAATLPTTAVPLAAPAGCDVFPTGQPGVTPNCGVFNPPPPSISAVITQCTAPGCNTFVAQPQPPITITGGGFGNFPNGMPFNGTSAYLQIFDTTQNWSAGFTGDSCTVSLNSWASNRIQLVANVNQNGACPLAAGDQVDVKVVNPQSGAAKTFKVTVSAN
jgi:hypothetical protein